MASGTRLRLLMALLLCLFLTAYVSAQDGSSEVTPEATEEPAVLDEQPTPEVTEEPTAAPTEAPPETTPETQPGEQPTATDEPVQPEQTTEPDAPTPDVISAPPVFEITSEASATAGQSIDIAFAVYDEQGAVVIAQIVSAAGAQTVLEIAAPVQTHAPYATTGTITYTPDSAFSGTDTLTLTAIDGAGVSADATVQINVLPVPVIEVTAEATAEATPEITPEATEDTAPSVERIINYDPNASEDAIQAMLAALNATEVSRIPAIGAMKVLVPDVMATTADVMAAVQSDAAAVGAGVTNVEVNGEYELHYIPNDPAFLNGTDQWALQSYSGSMYTYIAWDIAKQDGAGVLVAVLDTGVDLQHPDLAGQIDTAKGWDFINDDNNPDDDHTGGGHGTHVAGIIAAKTNNNQYMAGIAYRARIIPVKVCAASTGCPYYEIAAGIVHAVDRGAHIINMSLGGPFISTTVQGAVEYALAKNVTVIASAGNTGNSTLQYPASYPGVISVASNDINGAIASNSTNNNSVTISAPGVDVYSLGRLEQGGSFLWSGTSTSAANVSGVAALLYADNIARTPATIREALICSALDRGAVGYDPFFGNGIVQSDWAMNWFINSSNCKVTQPNDLFQNATQIKKVPFSAMQPVHSRSVTASAGDPADCFTATQTLWYKFIAPADERYQITTYGSSYNTVIAVYQGALGDLVMRGCAGAFFDPGAFVSVDMQKGQTYYIGVYTFGAAVNDQILQFDIRPAMSVANKIYQENANNIAYTGGWQPVSVKGASGGKLMQTWNDRGLATFTFRGSQFQLQRLIGPDQGSMEVWVNNVQIDFDGGLGGIQPLNNRAAVQAFSNQFVVIPNAANGQWNTVSIRRAASGFAGPIAFDYINPTDLALKVITAKTDDRDLTRLNYSAGWTPMTSFGAFMNTMYRTTTASATVQARVKGSTILIFRNVGPGYGSMNVFVDNVFWGTIDNNSSSALSVPFAITDQTNTEHVIRLSNNNASTLEFDAIQGIVTAPLAVNRIFDMGVTTIPRSGVWTVLTTPVAVSRKTYVTSMPGARMDFNFTGDGFCMGFGRRADGGVIDIFVDNMQTPYEQISTRPDNFWGSTYFVPPDTRTLNTGASHPVQLYCTGAAFADGVHHVRLVMTSAFPVELDYVNPGRVGLITSSSGLVQETDARIFHTLWVYHTADLRTEMNRLWQRVTMRSQGGASAQGGAVKRASFSPAPLFTPTIRFYISGSGFIIYTSSGPEAGGFFVSVCEPAAVLCSAVPIVLGGVDQSSYVNLNTVGRARPFAYAVTGLGPGIHEIVIEAVGGPGQYVDFDGVRVFP